MILATALLWTPDMPYWPLALWFFGSAVSMGWVMGPATDSVMGAVPPSKAGVASAMNDVARQVAGALGTALIGSLIASLYTTRISDELPTLSASARSDAEDSIGTAHLVASRLSVRQATHVIASSGHAYTDALGIGLAAAAVIAVAAAIVVKRRLPARHLPTTPAIPAAPRPHEIEHKSIPFDPRATENAKASCAAEIRFCGFPTCANKRSYCATGTASCVHTVPSSTTAGHSGA